MTFLTSEQYRDVLKHIPDCTEEIPTVQHLLRRAVTTFFKRFGTYPELAGVAPGKIGILGEQIQFNDGLALPAATPMSTIVVGRKAPGKRFTVVTSADVGKPHKVKFSFSRKRPLAPGCPTWLNYVKGVVDKYEEDCVPPFEAVIDSSVPMGVGFGSTSSLEVALYSFLEVLVGRKTSDPIVKAKACQQVDKEFAGKEVGLVERITSILAKDRHALLVDCKTNDVQWIPFKNRKVAFVAIDSHLKDTLFGDEYPERTKHISKACEILGVDSLRSCTDEDLAELENRVNEILESVQENEENEDNEGNEERDEEEKEEEEEEEENEKREIGKEIWSKEDYRMMVKRARFFITEMKRINEAIEAWNEGNMEAFGEKMSESHNSLKEDFDFNNPLLDFLVNASLEVEGVFGARMTGMGLGFGGGIISLMNKDKVGSYCNHLREKLAQFEGELSEQVKDAKANEKKRRFEIRKKIHSEHFNPKIASSERIGLIGELMSNGGELERVSFRNLSSGEMRPCTERKKIPCIVKVEKKKKNCGTWAHYDKERSKEEFFRKKSIEEEEELKRQRESQEMEGSQRRQGSVETEESKKTLSDVSETSEVNLKNPTFYIVSPFAGARMMFVSKTDILRSLFATPLPHPKTLILNTIEEFKKIYNNKVEAIGLAPSTVTLFGENMEFHLGYIVCMALPMMTVTTGGRNDSVCFSVKTLSKDVGESTEMKFPIPCVRSLEMDSRGWANFVKGSLNEFKGHVPGFNALINSTVPIERGLNSCAALQASFYTFLENLTGECTTDLFDKADRCARSEYEFMPAPSELVSRCSSIKFYPTFLCKEGHLMLIDCKRHAISSHFFDHPSYVFLIASVRENRTDVTLQSLDERLKLCMEAMDILGKKSLLCADLKHLRCLRKRDASEEMIKRVKYIITEHNRTTEAVKAIKDEDYVRVGVLMNESHASLRDDYEVSSPQIEDLIKLALSVEGVLGAKMVGKGLFATIVILADISHADECIRYMRKNYKQKNDKPIFYITKPSRGAFAMNPEKELPLIP